jgi:2-methylcitrate dehydratase PrpD
MTATTSSLSEQHASSDSSRQGVSRALASYVASWTYDMLPPELVQLTKQCILDTLGVILGASGLAPEGRILAEFVDSLGGKPESTVLGFGTRAPAAWAAFVNGSLGHMLDYDDVGAGHVSIATVPVSLAVAEHLGDGVSGRDLITAVAAGADLMTRIDLAVPIADWTMSEGWFATQLFGFIAGAAVAGHLLHLDADAMENALGIGFNQLSGSRQMAVGAATDMRSMQAGFSGQGAILAALLAQKGISGPKDILEGRYGLFRTYVRAEEPDWQILTRGLGTWFPLLETHGFKVWPSCGYTRPTNAALIELWEEGLRAEDVESIVIVGGSGGTRLLCEPLASKRRPEVAIDAKYSIPFTAAVAMTRGTVTLRDFTDAGLHDPAVLSMADRVTYRAAPQEGQTSGMPMPSVEVRTRDGRELRKHVVHVPGDPSRPVRQADLESKFRDCTSFAAQPLPPSRVEEAIDLLAHLEQLDDVGQIVRVLSPASPARSGEPRPNLASVR